MDIRNRGHISPEEAMKLATDLHALLLDETFHATRWNIGDAVFHGGTSIDVAHNSGRLSEDLDFMVALKAAKNLKTAPEKVAKNIRQRMASMIPGSELTFKVKENRGADGNMDVWDIRWSHPKRIGKVQVKMEFFRVSDELLADYEATILEGNQNDRSSVQISAFIPVATLVSLWGDKIKAIATRQAFKHRDAYDLGFISKRLKGEMPSEDALWEVIQRVANIYGTEHQEIVDGLNERLDDGSFDDLDAFTENMRNWFAKESFGEMERNDMFKERLEFAKQEVIRGRDIVHNNMSAGMKP